MANEQNIIPHQFTSEQNREEAAKNGSKGGRASGEARRKRKAFKEAFEILLSKEFTDRNGNQQQGVEILASKTFQKALDGDLKAIEFIRDTAGEKPAERIESVEIPQEVYERVQKALME